MQTAAPDNIWRQASCSWDPLTSILGLCWSKGLSGPEGFCGVQGIEEFTALLGRVQGANSFSPRTPIYTLAVGRAPPWALLHWIRGAWEFGKYPVVCGGWPLRLGRCFRDSRIETSRPLTGLARAGDCLTFMRGKPGCVGKLIKSTCTSHHIMLNALRPEHPANLSISLAGGKSINRDSGSNGERNRSGPHRWRSD